MIHWPDSMFTYIPEDKLLIPNDAFGQHIASSGRFDDEVDQCALMEEAEKYYANILIPLSPIISKKIAEVVKSGMAIDVIAPSHGVIWRKDPMKIVTAYTEWSKGVPLSNDVLIVYETMWKATEKMAKSMAAAIADEGINVKLYDINSSDSTEIIKDLLRTKCLIVGSSTHDNNMLPGIAGFLDIIKGLKLKGRRGAAFGSFGWSGEAPANIEKTLAESGLEIAQPHLSIKYVPSESDLSTCYDYGKKIAGMLK
jgi:flavorubredoxin